MTGTPVPINHTALRRLATLGLDYVEVRRQILDVLQRTIGFDIGVASTVDPATVLWTSCVVNGSGVSPEQHELLFQNEYCQDDIHKIDWLARRQHPVGVLSLVDEPTRRSSQRYMWMKQGGLVDELRSALMRGRNCWGSLILYRFGDSKEFSRQDAELVASLAPLLAQVIRNTLLRYAATYAADSPDAPGVVTVDEKGHIHAVSGTAEYWLEDLRSDHPEPAVIRSLILQLRTSSDGMVSAVAPGRSGRWIRLHASWLGLDGVGKAAVVLEPTRPVELAEILCRAYDLTDRQRQVAMWVARGLSSKEMASELGISPMTVNDHLKAVFSKVGVQSRQQLIANLFFDHCLPLRKQGATPSPYGWFLGKD